MLVHELLEVFRDVLATAVLVEHGIQVGEHVLEGLLALGRHRVVHGLRHVLELLVEHVAAQHLADLVVCRTGLGGAPVVVGELAHSARGVVGQHVEHRLAEAGVVGGVGEERGLLAVESLVEFLAHFLEQAVESPGLLQLAPALLDAAAQVVETAHAVGPALQEIAQRIAHRTAVEDAIGKRVDGASGIDRLRKRIGAAVECAVAVALHCWSVTGAA